ncbi:HEAT repeat protein [Posidoniimonas corsicana]|uniref:HEAT repeat protein n=1 Tax=Posidoniimonas corsicana TaxID=1938618 RepID=A0A5C5VCR3_9BACT|nr:HEAT repeat domain-containing protein [Posidoniimonas corsicana]TWT35773.1 HEAT repeat protein [Posidoniimonas corsicana]
MAANRGLERTLLLLTKTPNPSAIEVLDAGLRSDEPVVRGSAARALSRRRGPAAARALLLALPETPADVQQAVATRPAARRLRPGVIAALKGDDVLLCKRACRYAQDTCDPHVLPVLAEQASQADHPYGLGLATTALQLAKNLSEQIHPPTDDADPPAEDPAFARRAALNALVRAVDSFSNHRHVELVEAFALLAVPDDLVLRRVLTDATHAAHQPLLDALASSTAPGAMQIVSRTLLQDHPAAPLVGLLTSRTDRPFVEHLLGEMGDRPPLRALESARGLAGFAWAEEPHEGLLLALPGPLQANALKLAAATSMSKRRLTTLCELMIESGQTGGRIAACQVIGKVNSRVASTLIASALRDTDPGVVAAATTQLRNRGIEGSREKLIALLDHDHEEVQQAAQGCLTDVNYESFRAVYDHLEEPARRTHGRLVGKADPNCAAAVKSDLLAASPTQRLRTLEIAATLGIADRLADVLTDQLADPDAAVRAAAARALAGASEPAAREALQSALEDANSTVREAAAKSLAPLAPIDLAAGLVQHLQQEFPL